VLLSNNFPSITQGHKLAWLSLLCIKWLYVSINMCHYYYEGYHGNGAKALVQMTGLLSAISKAYLLFQIQAVYVLFP
jgi:hypothetical protein